MENVEPKKPWKKPELEILEVSQTFAGTGTYLVDYFSNDSGNDWPHS